MHHYLAFGPEIHCLHSHRTISALFLTHIGLCPKHNAAKSRGAFAHPG
ncbi:MAG: DUF2396 family protein [Leptolyngbya sp. DLM2.Bin27]|nr:MAG: DUF2396 family protein [Leptolyngbya sp. DLM2.Bin27]